MIIMQSNIVDSYVTHAWMWFDTGFKGLKNIKELESDSFEKQQYLNCFLQRFVIVEKMW